MSTKEFMSKIELLNQKITDNQEQLDYLGVHRNKFDAEAYITVDVFDFVYPLSPDDYDDVIQLLIKKRKSRITELETEVKNLTEQYIKSSQNIITSL